MIDQNAIGHLEQFLNAALTQIIGSRFTGQDYELNRALDMRIASILDSDPMLRARINTMIEARVAQLGAVSLIRFQDGRYFCGDQVLDAAHPELWGSAILATMAEGRLT